MIKPIIDSINITFIMESLFNIFSVNLLDIHPNIVVIIKKTMSNEEFDNNFFI